MQRLSFSRGCLKAGETFTHIHTRECMAKLSSALCMSVLSSGCWRDTLTEQTNSFAVVLHILASWLGNRSNEVLLQLMYSSL